eukprot:4622614-Lingulodinium_polyedra.AAC.1
MLGGLMGPSMNDINSLSSHSAQATLPLPSKQLCLLPGLHVQQAMAPLRHRPCKGLCAPGSLSRGCA